LSAPAQSWTAAATNWRVCMIDVPEASEAVRTGQSTPLLRNRAALPQPRSLW